MRFLRTSSHSSPRSSALSIRKGERHSACPVGTSPNQMTLSPSPYALNRLRRSVAVALRKARRSVPLSVAVWFIRSTTERLRQGWRHSSFDWAGAAWIVADTWHSAHMGEPAPMHRVAGMAVHCCIMFAEHPCRGVNVSLPMSLTSFQCINMMPGCVPHSPSTTISPPGSKSDGARTGSRSSRSSTELLREGLRSSERGPEARPYRTKTHKLRLRPGFDAARLNQLVDELETEERTAREVVLRR